MTVNLRDLESESLESEAHLMCLWSGMIITRHAGIRFIVPTSSSRPGTKTRQRTCCFVHGILATTGPCACIAEIPSDPLPPSLPWVPFWGLVLLRELHPRQSPTALFQTHPKLSQMCRAGVGSALHPGNHYKLLKRIGKQVSGKLIVELGTLHAVEHPPIFFPPPPVSRFRRLQ